jgi:uncharacterized membrane protein
MAMDWVLLLKLVHVLAAIVAVGATVTYAFWLRRAGADQGRLVWTIASIRALDNRVATPLYVVLLVTGVLMVLGGPWSFESSWIVAALVLYVATVVVAIVGYAPTFRRQLAEAERDPASDAYRAVARRGNAYGALTVAIVLVIVALMVVKPTLG